MDSTRDSAVNGKSTTPTRASGLLISRTMSSILLVYSVLTSPVTTYRRNVQGCTFLSDVVGNGQFFKRFAGSHLLPPAILYKARMTKWLKKQGKKCSLAQNCVKTVCFLL